jgi:hypothetical protein
MNCFAIDIETTGLDEKVHSLLEIAIISFDLFDRNVPLEIFHRYVIPENMKWTSYCLKLHEKLIKRLINEEIPIDKKCEIYHLFDREMQIPIDRLSDYIQAWLRSIGHTEPEDRREYGKLIMKGKIMKMIGAGKNFGTFDKKFIDILPQPFINDREGIFKHRVLDPTFDYIEPPDRVPPELKLAKARAVLHGGVFQHLETAHTAIEDCMDVVELCRIAYEKRIWIDSNDNPHFD